MVLVDGEERLYTVKSGYRLLGDIHEDVNDGVRLSKSGKVFGKSMQCNKCEMWFGGQQLNVFPPEVD